MSRLERPESSLETDEVTDPWHLQKQTAKTYDRIASEYEQSTLTASPAVAQLREWLVAHIDGGGIVLDLGCGPGRDVAWFRSRGWTAVGIDRSPTMAAKTAARGPAVEADLTSLPIASSSVRGVWSAASLLHVPSPLLGATLREWHRVLEPAGALALTTSSGGTEGLEVVPYAPERGPRSSAQLDRWFANHDENALHAALIDAGFVIDSFLHRQGHVRWVDVLALK